MVEHTSAFGKRPIWINLWHIALELSGIFAKGRCKSKGFSTFARECSCPMSAMDFVARSVWACILYARRVWFEELTWDGPLFPFVDSILRYEPFFA